MVCAVHHFHALALQIVFHLFHPGTAFFQFRIVFILFVGTAAEVNHIHRFFRQAVQFFLQPLVVLHGLPAAVTGQTGKQFQFFVPVAFKFYGTIVKGFQYDC